MNIQIGKRLRQRRTILGMNQQALAKAVGITFQQVQKYEKGTNSMNANRLYEFASAMHVPVAYFFEEAGDQNITYRLPATSEENEPISGKKPSDREALEMMKAFKRLRNPLMRKKLVDLLRMVADQPLSDD